jgi:ABC-2 type transport system ATP-binding protein
VTPALQTFGLTRHFGDRVAVEDLDLRVGRGECFALLGPNGAGKTTTVRLLCGLLRPTRGRVRILGLDLAADPQAIRGRVGLLTEAPGLYERLSAWENLLFHARLQGVERPETAVAEHLELLDLWSERHRPTAGFSKGMKQKLALARALLHAPDLLFLDEPTAGLDVATARRVRELLRDLRAAGRTLVLTTHDLDEAERLADRIALIDRVLLAEGTPDELRRRVFGRRVVVRLENAEERLAAVARARLGAAVAGVTVEDDRLLVETADPARTTPDLVAALAAAGARLLEVSTEKPSLEDVYLRLLEETGTGTHSETASRPPAESMPVPVLGRRLVIDEARLRAIIAKEWRDALRNRTLVWTFLALAAVFLALSLALGLFFFDALAADLESDPRAQRLLDGLARVDPALGKLPPRLQLQVFLLRQLLLLYLLLPVFGAMGIATYSIVGEKTTRSLEPLLATPATEAEILAGKCAAASLPAVGGTWAAFALFALAIRGLGGATLAGAVLDPAAWATIVLVTPLLAVAALGAGVLVSTRASDPRSAQQIGSLFVLPLVAVIVAQSAGVLLLGVGAVLAGAALLAAIDAGLLAWGLRLFDRDRLLAGG